MLILRTLFYATVLFLQSAWGSYASSTEDIGDHAGAASPTVACINGSCCHTTDAWESVIVQIQEHENAAPLRVSVTGCRDRTCDDYTRLLGACAGKKLESLMLGWPETSVENVSRVMGSFIDSLGKVAHLKQAYIRFDFSDGDLIALTKAFLAGDFSGLERLTIDGEMYSADIVIALAHAAASLPHIESIAMPEVRSAARAAACAEIIRSRRRAEGGRDLALSFGGVCA